MEDKKMELLCSKSIWQKAIDKSVDKRRNKVLLSYLCNPVGRAALIEAIADGRYVIQPPRTKYLDKRTGLEITREQAERTEKVRELYKPSCDMDAVVLNVIAEIYNQLYGNLIHERCKSYQSGIGVKHIIYDDLLPNLKKGVKAYKVDISKYFDSVNQETLFEMFDMMDTGSPVDKLIRTSYETDLVYLGKDDFTTERYMSLRQGNAFGCLLANLCLRDIDEMTTHYDVHYIRYSDDCIWWGEDADIVLENIKLMLLPKGLELNPNKVEELSTEKEFTFLGCKILNGTVDMSDESVERFKRDIKHITRPLRRTKGKGKERDVLTCKAIREVNNKLRNYFLRNDNNFGFEHYFYGLCNTDKTIRELDFYVKDHLKMVRAGSHIHARYTRITPNDWLKENGYISMVQMYKLFKMGPEVYKTFARSVM